MPDQSFSPGPYVVSRLQVGDATGAFIEDSDGRLIAHLCTAFDDRIIRCTPPEHRSGNLSLLAASWDLLRAARAAAAFLDDRAMLDRLRRLVASGEDGEAERQDLLRSLRNAVAKAEGRDEALIWDVEYPRPDDELADSPDDGPSTDGDSSAADRTDE